MGALAAFADGLLCDQCLDLLQGVVVGPVQMPDHGQPVGIDGVRCEEPVQIVFGGVLHCVFHAAVGYTEMAGITA